MSIDLGRYAGCTDGPLAYNEAGWLYRDAAHDVLVTQTPWPGPGKPSVPIIYATDADKNLHQDAPAILAAYVERGKLLKEVLQVFDSFDVRKAAALRDKIAAALEG